MTTRSIQAGIRQAPTTITTPSGIKVHHIQTGYVAVKRVHRSYNGPRGTGILAIALDPRWTEWMPITVWVIEHPEGVILIDTGEDSQVNEADFFACDRGNKFFYRNFLRFDVRRDEEIDAQLRSLGIPPRDVRYVIQTHLHGDHINGLKHFERSEILINAVDYPNALGAVPCRNPKWLKPTLVTYSADDTPIFGESYAVTQTGDVHIVPTPGHSKGHQSVILRDGQLSYFFAGDASFSEVQMLQDGIAGIAIAPQDSQQTTARIRAYARQMPTIYLPSHDPDAPTRLKHAQTVSSR